MLALGSVACRLIISQYRLNSVVLIQPDAGLCYCGSFYGLKWGGVGGVGKKSYRGHGGK